MACQRETKSLDVHYPRLCWAHLPIFWWPRSGLWCQWSPLLGPRPHRSRSQPGRQDRSGEHEGVHSSCVDRLQQDERRIPWPPTLSDGPQYGRPHCLDSCLGQLFPLWRSSFDRSPFAQVTWRQHIWHELVKCVMFERPPLSNLFFSGDDNPLNRAIGSVFSRLCPTCSLPFLK